MSIEGEAMQHMIGQGRIDSITIKIATNGYVIEYEVYVDKDDIIDNYEVREVHKTVEELLDSISKLCNNYSPSVYYEN